MKNFFFIMIFFVIIFSCGFATPVFAFDWVALHNQADAMTAEQARAKVQETPASKENLYVLGLVYLNIYEIQKAQETFQEILSINPQKIEARWGYAEVLRRKHRLEEAIAILQELIKERPDYSPAFITLAYIKYIQRDFNESVRLTGIVINHRRQNVDDANFLRAHGLYGAAKGMIAHYGGPISKAVNGAAVLRHLNIIQRLAPDSPVVNFGLGSYYMLIPPMFGQDFDKAQEYLEKAIEADPLFPDAYVRLAQIHKKNGDDVKYQENMQKALALDPKNTLALDVQSGECFFICLE